MATKNQFLDQSLQQSQNRSKTGLASKWFGFAVSLGKFLSEQKISFTVQITSFSRSVLGQVLSKIRFPLMTVEEFAQGPAQSGILADRECVGLFLHFTVNPKPPVGFLDVPRCSMTGKEQTVCRFQQIESRWGYSGTADKIRWFFKNLIDCGQSRVDS